MAERPFVLLDVGWRPFIAASIASDHWRMTEFLGILTD